MKQLLQYAIRCVREGGGAVTEEAQDAEAKVRPKYQGIRNDVLKLDPQRLVQELRSISALAASQS